jgi:hypothetical protein
MSARAARLLRAREPKIVEEPKCALGVRGTRTSEEMNDLLRDIVRAALA